MDVTAEIPVIMLTDLSFMQENGALLLPSDLMTQYPAFPGSLFPTLLSLLSAPQLHWPPPLLRNVAELTCILRPLHLQLPLHGLLSADDCMWVLPLLLSVLTCHLQRRAPEHYVCSVCLVTQSCPTLCDPTDCSQAPLSTGTLQARILQWVTLPSFRGAFQARDRIQVSCIAGGFFTIRATKEVQAESE